MASSATNERGLKKKQEQARRDRVTDDIITRTLMSTPDGRRWVWLRLEEAQIFNGNMELDPQYMAWEKGNRNSGLRLLNDVTIFTPREYITMTEEARSIKLREEHQDVRSPDDSDS